MTDKKYNVYFEIKPDAALTAVEDDMYDLFETREEIGGDASTYKVHSGTMLDCEKYMKVLSQRYEIDPDHYTVKPTSLPAASSSLW
jgi:hypothetical protein